MDQNQKLKFELLPNAHFPPDLDPSDYFLFSNMEKWLGAKTFANNEEVEFAVNDYFAELNDCHYKQGIKNIEQRWEKCIV